MSKVSEIGGTWRYDREVRRYGFLLCDNPDNRRFHSHAFFELAYVLHGEIDHLFHEREEHLTPGDYIFIDIGVEHAYYGTPDVQVLNFMFYPEALDPSFKEIRGFFELMNTPAFRLVSERFPLTEQRAFHDKNGAVLKMLEQIQGELREKRVGHHQMIRTLMIQLLILLIRTNMQERVAQRDNPLAEKILEIMDQRYAEGITLRELSARLNYSEAYMSRAFKRLFNLPFNRYLQRMRCAKSCSLLLETDWKIERVAEAVGYRNEQFYQKLFKKYFGMTPTQYRKNTKKWL